MDPILLVDDEKDNLEAIQRLLRKDYEVTTCLSPIEALQLVQSKKFHVIISDQRMPEMTGVELLEKAKRLSPSSTRVLLTGYTDIDSVIDAINRGNIYRYVAKPWDPEDLRLTLKQANEAYLLKEALEEKNRELSQSNLSLTEALHELEGLDRAKARFLSLISHELNTPLTVLSSFVAFLDQQKNGFSEDVQKAVKALSGACSRFQEIVQEVLTYVRLEAGKPTTLTPVELGSLVESLMPLFKAEGTRRKISLLLKASPTNVRADSEKLKQALQKLIFGLMEVSTEGTTIELLVANSNGVPELQLTGKGSPLSQAAFEPLEFTGNEMHHHKNIGLSLPIAKLILDIHHAKLVSREPSTGSYELKVLFPKV